MYSLLNVYIHVYSCAHFPDQDIEHFHQSETSLGSLPSEHPGSGVNHCSNFDHLGEMCNN